MIKLAFSSTLKARLSEQSPLIQVILGPRQVGKTTTIHQLMDDTRGTFPCHYASADAVFRSDWSWIERQWQEASQLGDRSLLVLDEIQKVENWSEVIKRLWDENKRKKSALRVVLLGSSSLALQSGLSESLTGRFELIRAYHWNYADSKRAFQYDLDTYLQMGGYPGADTFKTDENRWLNYIKNSVVETVLEKDILQLRHIGRPALFRQVFELVCQYPAMELSLRKLVGQLQDAGSIETVKSYLEVLEGAFLIKTLAKFSTNALQKRSSSPKLLPLCPALCAFARGETKLTSEQKGRVFELIVGLDLLRLPGNLFYWREDQMEVDYVYQKGRTLIAIEVKSGRRRSPHGLAKFQDKFSPTRCLTITPENYEQFAQDPESFLSKD